MPLTVFFAWQSDTDRRLNLRFIREAAEEAIKRLRADVAIEDAPDIELDHDTKGVTGTPVIAETIKAKINKCTVFLADLTYVSDYTSHDGRHKFSPNPNVLIELGIAMASRGANRIILVQNTAFGNPEDLPFDLRHHRFPIRYHLGDRKDADFGAKMETLTSGLVEAFKPIIEAELEAKDALEMKVSAEVASTRLSEATVRRTQFEKAVAEGRYGEFNFHDFRPDLAKTVVRPMITLTIIPVTPLPAKLDLSAIPRHVTRDMRPMFANGWEAAVFARSIVSHATTSRSFGIDDHVFKRTESLAELTEDGCIFAAEELLPKDKRHDPHDPAGVEFHYVERGLLMRLREYVQMLAKTCAVRPPLLVALSILRPDGVLLVARRLGGLRPLRDNVATDFITIPPIPDIEDNAGTIRVISTAMRPALNTIWRAAGLSSDPFFDAEGNFRSQT